jgi:hypothetical protein
LCRDQGIDPRGRVEDAIVVISRINARIVEMGGPPGQVYQELAGAQCRLWSLPLLGLRQLARLGASEDASTTDEAFQKLIADVVDPNGPIVVPFELQVHRSIPQQPWVERRPDAANGMSIRSGPDASLTTEMDH